MRVILIGLFALGLFGCASTPKRQLAAGARAALEAPAADYDSHAPESGDADAAAMRATYEAALIPALRERLTHDPRLDRAAQVQVEQYTAKREVVPANRMQWVLWRVGVPGRLEHARVWEQTAHRNAKELDNDLTLEAKAAELTLQKLTGPLSYGIFRGDTSVGSLGQAVVIASRRVELTAMPRRVAAGSMVPINGRVTVPAKTLRLAYFAAGADHHVDVPLGPDGGFSFELTAPTEPGRYHLDFSEPSTKKTLTTVNLFVDTTEGAEPEGFSSEVQTAKLKARLAEVRAEQGKQPNADFELEALARAKATRVCTMGDDPDDRADLVVAMTGLGHGNSVISSTLAIGAPFALLRDPTGDDPTWVTAVATCEIEKGPGDGKQYVLFLSASPGL